MVVLLDAFNAAPDVSNWVTAGNAMNTLGGKGISVAAPASGAWSLYTNWEQDGGRQWETFLADELPNWMAANKGLAPSGHGIVGAAQGGTGALTLATFHPDRYRFAGSLSGFLTPSNTYLNGAITAGLAEYGGVDTRNMWGLPQLGRWKWHDPDVHVQLLADNNTRLWVYSPSTLGCSDPAAMIGYCDQAQAATGPSISTTARRRPQWALRLPRWPQHDWGSWSGQLARCRANSSPPSSSTFRSPGPPRGSRYLGGMHHAVRRQGGLATFFGCSATSLLVASSAALLTGCSSPTT